MLKAFYIKYFFILLIAEIRRVQLYFWQITNEIRRVQLYFW